MSIKLKKKCALCGNTALQHQITEELLLFCCHGCHAVYQILALKQELGNYLTHPLFLQAVKSGLIGNPELLQKIEESKRSLKEAALETLYLEIQEMWCPSCQQVIYLSLMQKEGVASCTIDYANDLALVRFYPIYISKDQIFKIISSLSYKPVSLENPEEKKKSYKLHVKFIVAAFAALNIMMFSYPLYASYFDYDPEGHGRLFAWLSFYMSLPVLLFSFWPFVKRCFTALRFGIYGMEALAVLGVFSAFFLSSYNLLMGGDQVYFDSMAVIVAFLLLGKILEERAKLSVKDTLLRLNFSIPRRARKRFEDGSLSFVSLKEIKEGDTFAVFQGEKIALDGTIIEGSGAIDESLITGEALPSLKKTGEKVLGGSLLQSGRLFISAFANQESLLTRLVQMIEASFYLKPKEKTSLLETIVKYFVPFVLILAFFAAAICYLQQGGSQAFAVALSVLLISCPCAIGIAAPLAESYLISALGLLQVVVQNRNALSFLGKETVFVFDKTGTITEGKFKVVKGLDVLSIKERSLLKGMTSQSNHLISQAIFKSILEEPIFMDSVEEVVGKGLSGRIENDIYYFGSEAFLRLSGVKFFEKPVEEKNFSILSKGYFAKNDQLLSVIFLGDVLKKGIKELIYSLKPAKTVLLSGDIESTVSYTAKQCGFDSHYSSCSPLKKKDFIEELKKEGHVVCMVGDGINDAPSLASAHVAISAKAAADVSIQVSDFLLMQDDLKKLLKMRKLGVFAARILKQNLFWAFFYNMVGIALAAYGILSPIFAAFAMMISSLIVFCNARRLISE